MSPSSCLLPFLLLLAAVASLSVHAQQRLHFRTPATANLSTSWTVSLRADSHGMQTFAAIVCASIFLLQPIQVPTPQEGLWFSACFYCVDPCQSYLFGPDARFPQVLPQVVWSANRDHLVRENTTLSLTASSDLLLRDFDGSLIWSTGTSGKSIAGMTVTNSGNLVLVDRGNVSMWQSFSHPTDSVLPGQQLVEGTRLTPNASKTFVALTNYSIAFFTSICPISKIIDTVTGEMMYVRLESDGHLKLYQYNEIYGWQMAQDILKGQLDDCAYPTACGEYGVCIAGQCTCPIDGNATYFKPVDDRRINLGCTPVTPISCASMQDHRLLVLRNVSYFNYMYQEAALLPGMVDEERCKRACLKNCSCKVAFFFRYIGDDTSKGSCYLPTQVFSLRVNQLEETIYSSAYLKVQTTRSPPSPIPAGPSNSNGTVNRYSPTRKRRIVAGAIVGPTLAAAISILFVIIITSMVPWRRYRLGDDEDDFGEVPGMTTRFTFEQLKVATKQFSKMLGKGRFGSIFEGQVGEQRVAIKQLNQGGQEKKEFLAEVETIGNIHHINLVKLIGFCAEKSHRLLGLAYLHEECMRRIAHLDVKPQNILLDGNFNAKLSDFGLSKMIDGDKSQVITRMRGTPGYLAPEWLTSQITEKVDIYSFGVVIMEIISGRKNLDYSQPQESARDDKLEDLIDMNGDSMQIHKEEVIRMMKLAMRCLQIDYNKRPLMSAVVKILEGTMNVETNIEFNFVSMFPAILGNDGKSTSSALVLASHLSGPR
ncbi:hypothetical protein BS78_03G024600 [Paspalum vaginatum]|nr:hypothetical protein BS78_03G024600 [Paspalum vaginatum]